jgi:hypothetical protein
MRVTLMLVQIRNFVAPVPVNVALYGQDNIGQELRTNGQRRTWDPRSQLL